MERIITAIQNDVSLEGQIFVEELNGEELTIENDKFVVTAYNNNITISIETDKVDYIVYDNAGNYIEENRIYMDLLEEFNSLVAPRKEEIQHNLQLLANKEVVSKPEVIKLTLRNYLNYDLNDIKPQDEDAVRDLVMCIENDGDYAGMFNNIINNLGYKMKKGEYDEQKATKAFHNLVVIWLQDNHCGYTKQTISVHDRILVAHWLLADNLELIEKRASYKTITEVRALWNEYKKEYLQHIKKDVPALKLEFTYFIDNLCKEDIISVETYNNIGYR